MNYRRRGRFFFFPLIPIAAALLFGFVVMLLWNAILPQVVNAAPLSYWQAVGLLVLSRILFGSFFRGGHNLIREESGGAVLPGVANGRV